MYRFELAQTRDRLAGLDIWHRLTFAALCSERLLPSYRAFQIATGWGNVKLLRELLDHLYRLLGDRILDTTWAQQAVEEWAPHIPDTEQFRTVLVGGALNASAATSYTIQIVADQGRDPRLAAWAGKHAYEAADRYAVSCGGFAAQSRAFEQEILSSPVVQDELERQEGSLAVLEKEGLLSAHLIARLRAQSQEHTIPVLREGR